VGEYDSLTNCAKTLNLSVRNVSDSIRHDMWTFGKYLIKYKTENYPLKIEVGTIDVKTEKKPLLWITKGKKVIREYSSAKDASYDLAIPITTIRRAARYNNGKPIRSGHIFVYKDI
jgi:hypothetical protein